MNIKKSMRHIFGEVLTSLGDKYPEMVVLDCDVASSTQTKIFADSFPSRFFNCGIAEGNMVGIAAGMSTAGKIPVASTFAFLMAFRAGDDVRSLVAYNNLNVKLVGSYAGLSDFADGGSHQDVSDVAVFRSIPNMCILIPSDFVSTEVLTEAMISYSGPVYLRLSREPVGKIYPRNFSFTIGKANRLREGDDLTLVTCGTMLEIVMKAADQLCAMGVTVDILDYNTIKPFDKEAIIESARKTKGVITVEEHNIIGGLGSAVAETLSELHPTKIIRMGIEDRFGQSGDYSTLLAYYGLSSDNIVDEAQQLLQLKSNS